mgnify:CR=1 FL=1
MSIWPIHRPPWPGLYKSRENRKNGHFGARNLGFQGISLLSLTEPFIIGASDAKKHETEVFRRDFSGGRARRFLAAEGPAAGGNFLSFLAAESNISFEEKHFSTQKTTPKACYLEGNQPFRR